MPVLKSLFGGSDTSTDDIANTSCVNNMSTSTGPALSSSLPSMSIAPLTSSQIGSLTTASLGSLSNGITVTTNFGNNASTSNTMSISGSSTIVYTGGGGGGGSTGNGAGGGWYGGGYGGSYTIGVSGGSAGNVITTNGTGGFSWTSPNTTPWPTMGSSGIHVPGDAEFQGDIKIKGVSLNDRLDKIESRLGILRPNEKLESKWERLKALGDEYRELEKQITEGEKMWDILRK